MRLDDDDRLRRDVINGLLCNGVVRKQDLNRTFNVDFDTYFADAKVALDSLEADGLLTQGAAEIRVAPLGRIFNRNIAMTFDRYLKHPSGQRQFSKTV